MKKFVFALVLFVFIGGSVNFAQSDMLTQVSIIDALLNGVYDGNTTLGELKKYGNFGLGTFNKLDGEMVIYDGNFYKVRSDGKIIKQDESEKTPFAVIINFVPDITYKEKSSITLQKLYTLIDSLIPSQNYFYAVKIKGKFAAVQTRSVPQQERPYKPLAEVVKNQSVFNYGNTEGAVIGFRCPPFAKGVNVPGYHFHFLSNDFKSGGHVLDLTLIEGEIYIDLKSSFQVLLPEDEEFKVQNFAPDKESELIKVEKK